MRNLIKIIGWSMMVLALIIGATYTENTKDIQQKVALTFVLFLLGLFILMQTKKDNKIVKHRKNNFPVYHNQKHYSEMTRKEKREYKRWLAKNDIWDGAVVLENLEKNHRIKVEK